MRPIADQPSCEQPLVSVSVLTYNAAPFVREALDSILAQRVDFPVEIVVGDDRSTDGTRAILLEYAARYPQTFRLHLHRVRGAGIPGRINNVHNLTSCRGQYVALLDGDDRWLTTEKLQRQVDFLEAHPTHAAVGCDGVVLAGGVQYAALLPSLRGAEVDFGSLARHGVTGLTPSGLVFRRRAVMPLPTWFDEVIVADHFVFGLLMRWGKVRLLPGRYFLYRRHDAGFSATYLAGGGGSYFRVYDDYERFARTFPELPRSWFLDWRRVVSLVYVAQAALRHRRGSALVGVGLRLAALGPRRLARAVGRGGGGWALRTLGALPRPRPKRLLGAVEGA